MTMADRKARLAAELRANLHRRKAQARAAATAAIDPSPDEREAGPDDQPDRNRDAATAPSPTKPASR